MELPNLERLSKELEWFTLKYDFRNADKPWETAAMRWNAPSTN
ncbi:MAG: DUF6062 family protein [Christensenellales bacterium]